jgi:hypothetical protein
VDSLIHWINSQDAAHFDALTVQGYQETGWVIGEAFYSASQKVRQTMITTAGSLAGLFVTEVMSTQTSATSPGPAFAESGVTCLPQVRSSTTEMCTGSSFGGIYNLTVFEIVDLGIGHEIELRAVNRSRRGQRYKKEIGTQEL